MPAKFVLNMPISKQALKRWFSDEYLDDHPEIYDQFTKILNKKPEDHSNFVVSGGISSIGDIKKIKKITTKVPSTLVALSWLYCGYVKIFI